MRVAEIFETLEYGPARESAAPALEWVELLRRKLKEEGKYDERIAISARL